MREAIGGTQLFYLVLIFLTIYIIFMAGVINYGRAFRQKNAIINLIEQNEGIRGVGETETSAASQTLYGYAREVGYTGTIDACKKSTSRGMMFKIKISYQFELPMVGAIPIDMMGETKIISRPVNDELTRAHGITDCRNW